MIIVRLSGGIGNQLFQYAFGRALALRNHTQLGLDTSFYANPGYPLRTYDLDLFNIEAMVLLRKQVPPVYRSYGKGLLGRIIPKIRKKLFLGKGTERGFRFDEKKLQLGPDVYLDGYWQSYKYFDFIAATIRADFTLRRSLPENAQKLQDEIKSKHAVALHVRRGDYVGNALHNVVIKEYYDRALAMLKGKTTIDHLYIFSDDIAWCKENLSFQYPMTFVTEEYAGERGEGHLILMSNCKHFVIANSSFSWWAAWLAANPQKMVIAPKKWFADERAVNDLLPAAWITL